jgi:hypothetical protein
VLYRVLYPNPVRLVLLNMDELLADGDCSKSITSWAAVCDASDELCTVGTRSLIHSDEIDTKSSQT